MQYSSTQPLNAPRWDFRSREEPPIELGAVYLREGSLESQRPGKRGMTIQCISGAVWITQEGSPADIVLQSGERFVIQSSGKVIVQALNDASVRFI